MITHELKLDMIPNMSKNEVWVNQYDTDFLIQITLFASKGTFTVENGTTAAIRGTKPDGNGYSADASVNGNVVTVTGHEQMTVVAGRSVYELTLYKDDKELSTVNFNLRVERAALDKDTPTSKSQTRELVDIEEHADEIIAAVENMETYAEDSEAYAIGTRGGVAVESGDPAYQNNSKYYAEQGGAGNLAEEFSTSTAYAVGDYVRYGGKLYEFTTAHAAGAWNSAHVAETTVMDEVTDLKEDLSEIVPGLSDEAKDALLTCLKHIALWDDELGEFHSRVLEANLNNSFVQGGITFSSWQKAWISSDGQTTGQSDYGYVSGFSSVIPGIMYRITDTEKYFTGIIVKLFDSNHVITRSISNKFKRPEFTSDNSLTFETTEEESYIRLAIEVRSEDGVPVKNNSYEYISVEHVKTTIITPIQFVESEWIKAWASGDIGGKMTTGYSDYGYVSGYVPISVGKKYYISDPHKYVANVSAIIFDSNKNIIRKIKQTLTPEIYTDFPYAYKYTAQDGDAYIVVRMEVEAAQGIPIQTGYYNSIVAEVVEEI